jgi:uncharacterized delta-60 repeat protein
MRTHLITKLVNTVVITVSLTALAHAQTCPGSPGCLDPTFGVGGLVITSPPLATDTSLTSGAQDMVFQSDGKIVMVANAGDGTGTFRSALVRFTADGSLDASFGNGGFAYVSWSTPGIPTSMALQVINGQDYFLLAGGDSNEKIRCERFTSAGELDTSFGSGGVASVATGGVAAHAVAVQADQKILLSGGEFPVARLNANGTPDTTYGPGGVSRTNTGILIRNLRVTASGKVLIVGDVVGAKVKGTAYRDFAVARLNDNGTVDTTFGSRGKSVIDFAGKNDLGIDVAVDSTGKLVVCGEAEIAVAQVSGYDAALLRLTANGQLDTTFGTAGKTTLDLGGHQDEYASIAIQANGKILVTGEGRLPGNNADILTARYNSNGTLDTSFNSVGWAVKDFFGTYDHGSTGLIQIDPTCACEKYVIAGMAYADPSTSLQDIVGLRYLL